MAAAVSVGSAVPSSSWAVLPPHRNNIKLMSWRYVRCQCEIQLLNAIKGKIRHGTPRSNSGTKQLICFATLEGKSNSEPNLDPLKPDRLDLIAEDDSSRSSSIHKAEGKPGFVSFHGLTSQSPSNIIGIDQSEETPKIAWYIGPTVLVSFLVFPSLYLRRILSAVFEDSLLTDFLILFFTEALFYIGVAIFVLVVNHVRRPLKHTSVKNYDSSKSQLGLRVSSVATLVLSVIIPLVTMGMVWPWTGPAASATLAPYLVGLVVQFAFEQYARFHNSPAWPVIPIIFQAMPGNKGQVNCEGKTLFALRKFVGKNKPTFIYFGRLMIEMTVAVCRATPPKFFSGFTKERNHVKYFLWLASNPT